MTVLHADLNSFFASCEQQDDVNLRGKPVGVVQDSGKRSVIIGSSIEAKKLGIGTAMSIWAAKKIYAQIIIRPAKFDRYVGYSRRFRKLLSEYSDKVEVFSIDELFVDITGHKNPQVIAKEIKRRLKAEVGSWLTCSIGIAPNKILAKLASGSQKPDGLVIVAADQKLEFLDRHELWHICGIAERIQARMNKLGIYTIKQLRQAPVEILVKEFGVMGKVYSDWANGEDDTPVAPAGWQPEEKSFGNQLTLPKDVTGDQIKAVLLWLSWQVAARMREKGVGGRTVSLSVGFWHGQKTGKPVATAQDIYERLVGMCRLDQPVRFVGVSVGNLLPVEEIPMTLLKQDVQRERLAKASEKISAKYGPFYLRPAALLYKGLKETVFNGFTKRF